MVSQIDHIGSFWNPSESLKSGYQSILRFMWFPISNSWCLTSTVKTWTFSICIKYIKGDTLINDNLKVWCVKGLFLKNSSYSLLDDLVFVIWYFPSLLKRKRRLDDFAASCVFPVDCLIIFLCLLWRLKALFLYKQFLLFWYWFIHLASRCSLFGVIASLVLWC